MTRAWLLPLVLVGCSLDRSGVAEALPLVDSAVVASDTAAIPPIDEGVPVDSLVEDTLVEDTAPEVDPDAPLPDPLYIECESGALFGGVVVAADSSASGGSWASVPVDATPWTDGTGVPPARVELPLNLPAGTWYVWVEMYTRAGDADAMYVGFDGGPLRRFFSVDWNKFKWVGAEGSGAKLEFTLAGGPTKLYVGAGERGTGCDRVALTRVAEWTPP